MQNQQNFCTFFDYQPNNTNRLLRTMEGYLVGGGKTDTTTRKVDCSKVSFDCKNDGNFPITRIGNKCYFSSNISNGTPKPGTGYMLPVCSDDACTYNGNGACVSSK